MSEPLVHILVYRSGGQTLCKMNVRDFKSFEKWVGLNEPDVHLATCEECKAAKKRRDR
jgi:hypothetical protein